MRSHPDPCGKGSAYVAFQMRALSFALQGRKAEHHEPGGPGRRILDTRPLFDLMEERATCMARSFYFN